MRLEIEENKNIITEKVLGVAVQNWLIERNWDCFPEAQIRSRGPRADIIAIKDALMWVVETKLSLNLQVIEQALRWKNLGALYTSVGVLRPKRKKHHQFCWYSDFIDRFFRQEGLGLILINPDDLNISEVIKPKLHRYNYLRAKRIVIQLDPRMKQYIPGSSGKEGYSSPHQRTMENALNYIEFKKKCSINELLNNIETHFRIRAKSRRFLINQLCKHPRLSYKINGYNITFEIKSSNLELRNPL